MPRLKSNHLTIYLLKETYTDSVSTIELDQSVVSRVFSLPANGPDALFCYRQSERRQPAWCELFDGVLNVDGVFNASSAAVLIVPAAGRLFALTFGHGRTLLRQECWEERFGLRVTLNCVGEQGTIKSIDKRVFDELTRQSREQTSRDANVEDFGLDVERDLLRAVTGVPEDRALGTRMTGKDVLAVSVATRLSDIPELLGRYLMKYTDTTYRRRYAWLDQIAEASATEVTARLDTMLLQRIQAGQEDGLWMAVPDIVEWSELAGLSFSKSPSAPVVADLSIAAMMESIRDREELTVDGLKRRKVFAVRASDDARIISWTVYRCIYCEIAEGNDTYLLSDGKWYRIATDFVQAVNEAVSRIPSRDLQLPAYEDDCEATYVRRVCAGREDTLVMLDRANTLIGGHGSRVEFCDIFTREQQLIHVKRYAGSSVLSHLFAQGAVAGEIFASDSRFRTDVNKLLPAQMRLVDPAADLPRDSFELVYAVISKTANARDYPFFSKVNLKNAARTLQRLGYRVAVAKIPVTPEWLERERTRSRERKVRRRAGTDETR